MRGLHIQLNCCSFSSPKSSVWPCTFKYIKVTDITTTTAQCDELSVNKLKDDPNSYPTYQKIKQLQTLHLHHTNSQNNVEAENYKSKPMTHCNSSLARHSEWNAQHINNVKKLHSETHCLSPFISGLKADASIDSIHSHNDTI